MVRSVVDAPCWIDGVKVGACDEGGQKRMTAIQARVEQTHPRRSIVVRGDRQSSERFLGPLLLLFRIHSVEKSGGFLCAAQLSHAIQRHHRCRELLLRAEHQHDGPLREVDLAHGDLALGEAGQFAEICNHRVAVAAHRQPDLPPEGLSGILRQQGWIVGPHRSNFGAANGRDSIQQRVVIKGVAVCLLAVGQVVLDVLFEMIELPVRDEDIGVSNTRFGADAKHLDHLPSVLPNLAAKAFKSEGHIWHAGELNLETEATFETLLLLGCDHLQRNWLQRDELSF